MRLFRLRNTPIITGEMNANTMSRMLFFILIAAVNLCSAQKNSSILMSDFIHRDFILQYPETWKADTSKQWGAEVMIFSPIENETDKFSENVNVLIQDLGDQPVSLEYYKEVTEQQISLIATDANIIESTIKKSANGEFYRFTYTMSQGVFKLKITSECYIHNGNAYLLTFTAEIDKFDDYRVIGEKMLDSFELIK